MAAETASRAVVSESVYMSGPFDRFANLRRQSDTLRTDFLRAELATGFTLASLANTEYHTGDDDAGSRATEHAEKAYATLVRFLADPKHAGHLTDEDRRQLKMGTEQLRKELDYLRGLREKQ